MKRILLVEDDGTIVLGITYSLQQEGYEVDARQDMRGALEALRTGAYDLAILDLWLPDGSGYDICREIRKQGDMPVLFLTACDEEANVVMGLDMGADDYITKPFRVRELLSRIKNVLRRNGARPDDAELHIGDIAINTRKARVTKSGVEVPLTAMEYRLLLTLARNEGQVLMRGQLLEGIWDISEDFVNDNTLTVYIKRLREKIEDDPQNPRIIHTLRGMGYKAGD